MVVFISTILNYIENKSRAEDSIMGLAEVILPEEDTFYYEKLESLVETHDIKLTLFGTFVQNVVDSLKSKFWGWVISKHSTVRRHELHKEIIYIRGREYYLVIIPNFEVLDYFKGFVIHQNMSLEFAIKQLDAFEKERKKVSLYLKSRKETPNLQFL